MGKQQDANNSETLSRVEEKLKPNGYLIFCLLTAAFGAGFQNGWCLGVFNTPADVLQNFYRECFDRRNEKLTDSHLDFLWSVTNGMLPFGGLFGGFMCGFLADYWGRKQSIIRINALIVISAFFTLTARFFYLYELIIVSKLITGIVCGLYSGLGPLYLSELAPLYLRGAIGTLNQIMMVSGILVTNILGLPQLLGSETLWPVLVNFTLVPSLVCMFLFRCAESPKYLVKNKRVDEARESLLKLRNQNAEYVESEINELIRESVQSSQQAEVSWSDFWTVKTLRRPLIVTMCLQLANQLCGINAVIFYSEKIFRNAGLEGSWPIYATILLGVVQVMMTIVCSLLIERAGRKMLLFTGMVGLFASAFSLAAFRIIGDKYDYGWSNIATVIAAIAYIIFFSIGPGAIPWLITSELFKSDARGKAASIAVFVNWLANFSVIVSFIFIERLIGSYSFILFGTLSVLFSVFIFFFVPETKGKSIEEIVDRFEHTFVFRF